MCSVVICIRYEKKTSQVPTEWVPNLPTRRNVKVRSKIKQIYSIWFLSLNNILDMHFNFISNFGYQQIILIVLF